MTTIRFYNYNGRFDAINKVLPTPIEVTGELLPPFDVLRPSIRLASVSKPTYNYAYLNDVDRYYFVDEIEYAAENMWVLSLRVDVLTSYASSILAAKAVKAYGSEQSTYDASNRNNTYNVFQQQERLSFDNPTNTLSDTGTIIMVTLKG